MGHGGYIKLSLPQTLDCQYDTALSMQCNFTHRITNDRAFYYLGEGDSMENK
jgi:hypothetical protein